MGETIRGANGKVGETTRDERDSGRNDSVANGKVGETTRILLLCKYFFRKCGKKFTVGGGGGGWGGGGQDQDQDSLLVKRRNDNHSPGPVIRELVPSSHQRSELSNTILCIFSG